MPKAKTVKTANNKPCAKRKRASATDGMQTAQEKLQSGVDRKPLKMEDRGDVWVIVPGEKGCSNYIYNVKDRLKADRFQFSNGLWCKNTSPGRVGDSAIGDGLSPAQKERMASNRAKALEIRVAKKAVEEAAKADAS
eukprot:1770376-Prymnesium_polylepis.1